jgi:hypothetical protein
MQSNLKALKIKLKEYRKKSLFIYFEIYIKKKVYIDNGFHVFTGYLVSVFTGKKKREFLCIS